MKRIILMLLSVWGVLFSQAQQIINLHTGKFEKNIMSTVPSRDVERLEDGYMVTYTFSKAFIQPDILFSGTVFWKMDGFGMNDSPGSPSTLVRSDFFSIPVGYNARVVVTDSIYSDFDYELTPARQPLLDSNKEKYTKQNVHAIKAYNGFKPLTVVSLSGIQSYRGHNICQTTISPIQYNYKTQTVRAYTSITYKVTFIPESTNATTAREENSRLSGEDHFMFNNVIGGSQMRTDRSVSTDVQDYLILSTNTYSEAVNRFADWKRLLGFNVHVVFRDSWTSDSVLATVSNAYSVYPALYYLLIVGDHNDVPAKQSSLIKNHVTDFYYGCVDNDLLPDVYCGRLSVSTSEEAMCVVDKIIGYEKTPPTCSSFYDKGLHCAYFQDDNTDSYADRRFAQTSEDVRAYVMLQGKNLQRVYTTPSNVTPLHWNNTSFSYGEDIPDELKKPGFAWDGDSVDISNAINNGVFYVLHRDHGAIWGWGSPRYTQQNVSNLSNENLLPVVFSMNCLTGKFDGDCFAETFLRKYNGGCVAIYGASEVSYTGYNDALTTGMFDAIWPSPGLSISIPSHNNDFSTTPAPTYTLGQILAQGEMRLAETYGSNTNYVKYTKELFHCFGDPSMKIYTQIPTTFNNVSITRNISDVHVCLEASDTARITVFNPVNGDIQSYMGNTATVATSDPDEVIICVSGHNRIPYIHIPDVMYIQNMNIAGVLNESHEAIKVGNHVTATKDFGDVTTFNADITLRARKVVLDGGTHISIGSSLKIVNP